MKREFLAVTPTKLFIMSTVTFGLYEIYWAYKQWKALEEHKGIKIVAWARAFFITLFLYALARHIYEYTKSSVHKKYPPILLGVGYFVLTGLWKLPPPYDLISFLSPLPLIPIQIAINEYVAKENSHVKISSAYSKKEIALLIIGGIFVIASAAISLGLY